MIVGAAASSSVLATQGWPSSISFIQSDGRGMASHVSSLAFRMYIFSLPKVFLPFFTDDAAPIDNVVLASIQHGISTGVIHSSPPSLPNVSIVIAFYRVNTPFDHTPAIDRLFMAGDIVR